MTQIYGDIFYIFTFPPCNLFYNIPSTLFASSSLSQTFIFKFYEPNSKQPAEGKEDVIEWIRTAVLQTEKIAHKNVGSSYRSIIQDEANKN